MSTLTAQIISTKTLGAVREKGSVTQVLWPHSYACGGHVMFYGSSSYMSYCNFKNKDSELTLCKEWWWEPSECVRGSPSDPFIWCGSIAPIPPIGPSGPGPMGNCTKANKQEKRWMYCHYRRTVTYLVRDAVCVCVLTLGLLPPGPMGFIIV